jgi:hypothetical protein
VLAYGGGALQNSTHSGPNQSIPADEQMCILVLTGPAAAAAAGKPPPPAARPATGNKGASGPAGAPEALAAGVQAAIDSCKAEVQAAASSYYSSKVRPGCAGVCDCITGT